MHGCVLRIYIYLSFSLLLRTWKSSAIRAQLRVAPACRRCSSISRSCATGGCPSSERPSHTAARSFLAYVSPLFPLFPGTRSREFLDFSEEVAPPLSRSLRVASIYRLSRDARPELAPSRSHLRPSCACSLFLPHSIRSLPRVRARGRSDPIRYHTYRRIAECVVPRDPA